MFQPQAKDPTKEFEGPINTKEIGNVVYQPTEITRELETQIFWFEAGGMFIMVYASNAFKFLPSNLHFVSALLMALAFSTKPCNANLNPAVTLAFCTRNTKRYQWWLFWGYFKAQILGSFCGYLLIYWLSGEVREPFIPESHTTEGYLRIILSEMMGVFLLVISVLKITGPNTSYISGSFDKYLYICVFAYMCGMYCPASGFSGNLGFTFGRAILAVFFKNLSGLQYCWLWVLGDFIGCMLAVYLYNNLVEPQIIVKRAKDIRHRKQIEMQQLAET